MWRHRRENNGDAAMQEDRKMRGKVAVGLLRSGVINNKQQE